MSTKRVNLPRNDSAINNDINSMSFFKQQNSQNQYDSKRLGNINLLEYEGNFTRNEEPSSNVNDDIELYLNDEKVLKITEPEPSYSTSSNSPKNDLSKIFLRKKSLKTKKSEPTSVNNAESSVSPSSTLRKCCSCCCIKSKQETSLSSMYKLPKLSAAEEKVSTHFCPLKMRYVMLGGNRYSPARVRRRYAKQRSAESSRLHIQNLPESVELMKVSSTGTIDINDIKNEIRLKLNKFNNITSPTIQTTDTKKNTNEIIEIPEKIVEESVLSLNDTDHENFIPEETFPRNENVVEDDITSIDNKTFMIRIKSNESSSTMNSVFTVRPHISSPISSTSSIKSELTGSETTSNKESQLTLFCSVSLPPKLAEIVSKKQNKNKFYKENFKRFQIEINQNYINYRQLSNRFNRKYTSITRAIDNRTHKSVSLTKIDGLTKAFYTQINDGSLNIFANKSCPAIGEKHNKQELIEIFNKHIKFPSIDDAMQRTWEWVNNIENNVRADDTSESIILSESDHESTWDYSCNLVNSTRLINENNTSQLENVESIAKQSESFVKMQLKLHQILHPESISSVESTPLFISQPFEEDCFVTDALKYLSSSEHIQKLFEKKKKIPSSNWTLYECLLPSERELQNYPIKSSPKTTPINQRYCCLIKIKNALRKLFLRRKNLKKIPGSEKIFLRT